MMEKIKTIAFKDIFTSNKDCIVERKRRFKKNFSATTVL